MSRSADVIIVGGGVIGSACAYYLQKQGFSGSILILERDTTYTYAATGRSAGGLRMQFSRPENIRLSQFGLALLRNLEQEFGPGTELGFKELGYLILASDRGLPILQSNVTLQTAHGAHVAIYGPEKLAQRFDWLNVEGLAAGAFGERDEGWLDPHGLMSLLRRSAQARGAKVEQAEVTGIETNKGRIQAVMTQTGERISCGLLINAAGAGAGALAGLAGFHLPVAARKRYVYVLDCPQASEALHTAPLTVDPLGCYFRPEGRHFICGLSPEEHDEPAADDFDVDYTWFEERIWPVLAERIPAFEAIKVINAWAGHYDYNALDQNGIIGKAPGFENFYLANGFSGHGLQQGPGVGNAIAELITQGRFTTIDLANLGPQRLLTGTAYAELNVI